MIPSPPTVAELLGMLEREGELPGDAARAARARAALRASAGTEGESPWYVKGLVGFGSIVAVTFLLFFLFQLRLLETGGAMLGFGAVFTAASSWVRWMNRDAANVPALIVCVAGEIIVFMGFAELGLDSLAALSSIALVGSAIMFVAFPDRLHRFACAVASVAALSGLFQALKVPYGVDLLAIMAAASVHALLHRRSALESSRFPRDGVGPLLSGLMCATFGLLLVAGWWRALAGGFLANNIPVPMAAATFGIALVTIASVVLVLRQLSLARPVWVVACVIGTAVFALVTWNTPGLLLAVGLVAVTYHRREGILLQLSLAFVVAFGVLYYYDLSLTLFAKSGALVGAGVVLLALRAVLSRAEIPPETRDTALEGVAP